ncbi:MAG: hypothetical protein NC302_04045 [Bacteroidales bacterium]|nr:hypothetical protein [Bacteroidales bacterium]MCM1414817.1 hypothetical protein [bacterium]MCM1422448.1 hypothetical protein [bacterium]
MDRAEFMRRLSELLQDVPPAEREEALQYYNDYLDDAGEGNEVSVIASLGTPEELAKSIKAGLSDGGNAGEFTEAGFRAYGQNNQNQVMSTNEMQSGAQNNAQGGAGNSAQGAGNGFGGSPSGQQAQNTYGAYGQQAQNGYGAYGQQAGNAYGQPANAGVEKQKKSMSGDRIALIVILAILTSPIWIGVLGAAFGCIVGLLAALLGIFIAVFVVAVVFLAVGASLFVSGFAGIFAAPLPGICLVGVGLILFALGLLFGCLMVWMIAAAIPALVRACVNLCRRIFGKGAKSSAEGGRA